jgi:HK97 family phage major capsid protein
MYLSQKSRDTRAKINAAAKVFFRSGYEALNGEQRALLSNSDGSGGALISQSFSQVFLEASKYNGPVFDLVHRIDSEIGEPRKFVITDSTTQTMSLLSQGTTSASSKAQTPTVFSDITDTDTLITSVIYSVQESDDASSLEDFLNRTATLAVARAREVATTLGITNDGTSTALPNSPAGGLLASVGSGVVQSAGTLAAGITYAQLSALAGSVDRSYYANGAFMASPSVETALRSQVDSTGRPLYQVGDDGLLIIAGRKLYPNSAMAASGTASAKLVLFGDFSRAYSLLSVDGVKIKILSNNSSPNLALLTREMLIYTRLGATTGVSNAVKALVSAAS